MPKFYEIKNNPLRSVVRLPHLGKIKLGIKVKKEGSNVEYPKETDYFVCPPEVQKVFGEKPKELRIMFPTGDPIRDGNGEVVEETIHHVLRQYNALYASNRSLVCQGNGEEAERRDLIQVDGAEITKSKTSIVKCVGPTACEFSLEKGKRQNKPACAEMMDLMFMIPEVSPAGVYKLTTKSITSDIDIRSGIQMTRVMVGRISFVPITLRRVECLIPDPKDGKMIKHWTLHLEHMVPMREIVAFKRDNDRVFLTAQQTKIVVDEPELEAVEDVEDVEVAADGPATTARGNGATKPAATPPAASTPPPAAPATAGTGINPAWSQKASQGYIEDLRHASDKAAADAIASSAKAMKDKLLPEHFEAIKTEYARIVAGFQAAAESTTKSK